MKKLFILSLLAMVSTWSVAQLRTPQPSPAASFTQTVGVTDVTVKYSRPAMRGREIFGKLIPYDKVWRTGANAATSIELSTDVMVEGQKLPAGKYAIMTIPSANQWTVIFSKNLGVSEQNYKQEEDAIRVNVKPTETSLTQSFSIWMDDISDSTANLNIAWEKTRVPIKIMTETTQMVEMAIDKSAEASSNNMLAGANFLLGKGMNLQKALTLINQAVGLKETFRNIWTKAQILAKLGNFAEAAPLAKKALELGQSSNDPAFGFFKDAIQKGAEEYLSKVPMPAVLPKKKK